MHDVGLYLMAFFYILAGINHFRAPKFYLKIIPPFLPQKELINIITGVVEIVLGAGLIIPAIQNYAAWGIILLLVAIFPANIYHLMARGAGMRIPVWLLWVRLPIQFLLIYWAYVYTS